MTPEQLEHLCLLKKHLENLLATAEKRTPGEWKWHWRDGDDAAPGSIFATPQTGHAYAVAMCPKYGRHHFSDDADFIASCADNAEAGWRSTLAAIDLLLEMERQGCSFSYFPTAESILDEWPLDSLKP